MIIRLQGSEANGVYSYGFCEQGQLRVVLVLLQDVIHLHAGNEHSAAGDWRIQHGINPPKRGSKEQQEKHSSIYN